MATSISRDNDTSADQEISDIVNLDYNARPTIVPRASTLLAGLTTYTLIGMWTYSPVYDFENHLLGVLILSVISTWLYNQYVNCLLPNQIRLLDQGIAFGWNNLLFNLTAPIIPWKTITSATFERYAGFGESVEGSILLNVNELPRATRLEYPYQFLNRKIWKRMPRATGFQLRIQISGLPHNADREHLAKLLHERLSPNSVHFSVLRSLDPRFSSALFKNALQVSTKRLPCEDAPKQGDLSESLHGLARLLPRSIMREKVRETLGLKDGEVLSNHAAAAAQNSESITFSYKPLRMLRPFLENIERSGTLMFFCISLPLILLGVTMQMLKMYSYLPVALGVVLGIPTLLLVFTLTNPDQITLSQYGLRLTWHRGALRFSCPGIPWSNVSLVSLTKPKNSWPINTTISFHIQPDSMPCWQRLFYLSFFQPFFTTSNHVRITLIESGFLHGAQKMLFKNSLLQYLAPERLDPMLMDYLSPPLEENFTSLWLSSLKKERVRIEPLEEGDLLADGRYRVKKQIGAGGQGIAYQAECIEGGQDTAELVVLKEFIIPSHAGQSAQAKALASVQHECQLLQRINHPFVIKMKDSFLEDHRFYLVLEHAPGESLRKLVNENGPLGNMETMELAMHLLGILCHLHSISPPIIHRDFTPENIIIAGDGTPKLIDFNVARQSESTATRTVVGKHSYIPPEQFRGKASTQSDIYALGASLYFALTGEDPEPISPSHPRLKTTSVSSRLDEIIFRATQPNTDDRYKSADEMREDLLAQVPAS